MKIFVVADARGNVESVAIPNPALAANIGMEAEGGRRVHVLDVAAHAMTQEDLLDPKSDAARRKLYVRLRRMIAGTRQPQSGGGRPRWGAVRY